MQNDDNIQTLIPTKNKPALLSYYFGIFGLIPFLGLPFTILAIIFSIIGLKQFKNQPTPGAKGHALVGLILGIVQATIFMIYVVAGIFVVLSGN